LVLAEKRHVQIFFYMMNSGSIRQSFGAFGWDLFVGSTERTGGIFSYSNIAAIGWYIYYIYQPKKIYVADMIQRFFAQPESYHSTVFIEHAIVGILGTVDPTKYVGTAKL
jgi:hypothetical protein